MMHLADEISDNSKALHDAVFDIRAPAKVKSALKRYGFLSFPGTAGEREWEVNSH
jgi:hypothetical protein